MVVVAMNANINVLFTIGQIDIAALQRNEHKRWDSNSVIIHNAITGDQIP